MYVCVCLKERTLSWLTPSSNPIVLSFCTPKVLFTKFISYNCAAISSHLKQSLFQRRERSVRLRIYWKLTRIRSSLKRSTEAPPQSSMHSSNFWEVRLLRPTELPASCVGGFPWVQFSGGLAIPARAYLEWIAICSCLLRHSQSENSHMFFFLMLTWPNITICPKQ